MRQKQFRAVVLTTTLSMVSVLFLRGCIPVEDLGEYWEQEQTDPLLEGQWKKIGTEYRIEDEYLTFEKADADKVYIYKTYSADRPDSEEDIAYRTQEERAAAFESMGLGDRSTYYRWKKRLDVAS